MYELIRGPLVWIAFLLFVGGALYQGITLRLMAKKEGVALPTMNRWGWRSVGHWIVPFATKNWRLRPLFTIITFAFHGSLLVVPIFLLGHMELVRQAWGLSWWTLPPMVADLLSLVVVIACVYFILRRIAAPEVRYVSTWWDLGLALLVGAPFLTGLMAHHQVLPYRTMIAVHIVSGALWLIAIPFTRLTHMLWFIPSRTFMGNEFGGIRHSRDW